MWILPPKTGSGWQSTDRDQLRADYWHLARRLPSAERADLPHPREVFLLSRRAREEDFHDVQVFDTTLRDGAQREGLSYSVADKLAVARLLDEFGVGFIEGGWPGAVPKDTEFFRRARTELDLKHAVLVAFGATRKAGVAVADDPQVRGLLDAQTPAVCLVAKSDLRHVERALRTTAEENLAMVRDTRHPPGREGRRVFVDCEHFFDGFRFDPEYTARGGARPRSTRARSGSCSATPTAACCRPRSPPPSPTSPRASGSPRSCSASTARTTPPARSPTPSPPSRPGCGTSRAPPTATASGPATPTSSRSSPTFNSSSGMPVLPDGCLEQMARVSHAIAEIANIAPDTHQAYVGSAAFAHKAGLHASAIKVDPPLYNHVDPAVVGNDMRILVTEMAGRASIELKSRELGLDLAGHPEALSRVTHRVKELEAGGWSFEAADASFELLVRSSCRARP